MRLVSKNLNGSRTWELTCMACERVHKFDYFADPLKWAELNRWVATGDDELCPACAPRTLDRWPLPDAYQRVAWNFNPIDD